MRNPFFRFGSGVHYRLIKRAEVVEEMISLARGAAADRHPAAFTFADLATEMDPLDARARRTMYSIMQALAADHILERAAAGWRLGPRFPHQHPAAPRITEAMAQKVAQPLAD